VLALLILTTFMNTLGGGFIYDDHRLIEENTGIRSFRHVPKAFTTDSHAFHSGQEAKSSYYRPLLYLSYMIDYAVWGREPWGFHLSNVLFHALAVVLAYLLLLRLFRSPWLAAGAAALWGVHPISSESVAWITGRTDVMAAVFIFGTLLLYIRYRETGRSWFLYLALSGTYLACLGKETAAVIPVLALITDVVRKGGVRRLSARSLAAPAALLIPVGLFLVQRSLILDTFTVAEFPGGSRLEGLRVFCRAAVYYAKSLLWPTHLVGDIHIELPAPGDVAVWIGGLFLAGLLAVAGLALRKQPGTSFPLLWAAVTLAPAAGVLVPIPFPVALRYLYLPSLGLLLGVLWLIGRLNRSWLERGILGILLVVLAGFTVTRNREYRDDSAFYSSVLRHAPHAGFGIEPGYYTLLNYGEIRAKSGQLSEAEALLRRAVGQEPLFPLAWNNLGNTLALTGKAGEALESWERAIALDASNPDPYMNVGITQENLGRHEEAVEAYEKWLALVPEDVARRHEIANRVNRLRAVDSGKSNTDPR
jgi:hypothetical protein